MSVTGPGTNPCSSGNTPGDASALIFPAAPSANADFFPLPRAKSPPDPALSLAFALLLTHDAVALPGGGTVALSCFSDR